MYSDKREGEREREREREIYIYMYMPQAAAWLKDISTSESSDHDPGLERLELEIQLAASGLGCPLKASETYS